MWELTAIPARPDVVPSGGRLKAPRRSLLRGALWLNCHYFQFTAPLFTAAEYTTTLFAQVIDLRSHCASVAVVLVDVPRPAAANVNLIT